MSEPAADPAPDRKPIAVSAHVYEQLTDRKRRAELRLQRQVTYSEILERMLEQTKETL